MRAWLATDTHRSRGPDELRLTGLPRRSNPHRSATLLIGISTSPRFPPWRLVQHLPPSLARAWTAQRPPAGVGQPLTDPAGRERPVSACPIAIGASRYIAVAVPYAAAQRFDTRDRVNAVDELARRTILRVDLK